MLEIFGWQEHILGVLNTGFDRELRKQDNPTEWMLNKLDFFKFIKELCLTSGLEHFTSRFKKRLSASPRGYRDVARNFLEGGSRSSGMSAARLAGGGILGCRAARVVHFGPFSMEFQVLQPAFFGRGAVLCALDLGWGVAGALWVLRGFVVGNMKFFRFS